jgi:hypothetical protein
MDIELIHEPSKDNVMPDALSGKKEYQGEMLWENIQILLATFVGKKKSKMKDTISVCGKLFGAKLF